MTAEFRKALRVKRVRLWREGRLGKGPRGKRQAELEAHFPVPLGLSSVT